MIAKDRTSWSSLITSIAKSHKFISVWFLISWLSGIVWDNHLGSQPLQRWGIIHKTTFATFLNLSCNSPESFTFVFGPANNLIWIWASFRISPIAITAPSGQLTNTSLGVWQVVVLHPLITELAVSIMKLVLWDGVISPTPNPQPGGAGFFCQVFLPLVTDSS